VETAAVHLTKNAMMATTSMVMVVPVIARSRWVGTSNLKETKDGQRVSCTHAVEIGLQSEKKNAMEESDVAEGVLRKQDTPAQLTSQQKEAPALLCVVMDILCQERNVMIVIFMMAMDALQNARLKWDTTV